MIQRLRHVIDRAKRFGQDRRGATLVEFSFVVPILTFITLASIELGRYAILNQKLTNAATSLAELAARDGTITAAQLDSMFAIVPNLTQPYDFANDGVAIVTSIIAPVDDAPEVAWQRSGGGTLVATSTIGTPGNSATIPSTLPTRAGDTIIAAEVVFDFHPIFNILLSEQTMRKSTYVRPRIGTLDTLD
ncbi:MAG: TadE/TadG family type IV pilus assembly protein [Candidatus Eiseniibacteriota bacterium]